MTLRLAVVLTTFNGERFLEKQLASILCQVRHPDQMIVSDDGSTDRTAEIVREFARRAPFEVMVRTNAERLGYGENFVSAMQMSDADLIAFCDQDDIWRPDKLGYCAAQLENDERVTIVVHAASVVDADLRPQGTWHPHIKRSRRISVGHVGPAFGAYPGFATMVRARCIPYEAWRGRPYVLSPLDHDLIGHDEWVSLVCSALGDMVLLRDELALYRRHSANTSPFAPGDRFFRLRRSLALSTQEAQFFRQVSQRVVLRARYLESLLPFAAGLDEAAVQGLERAVTSFDRYARAMDARATMYDRSTLSGRMARLVENLALGHYGREPNGRLGWSSLGRDVAFALAPRRAVNSQ